MADALSPTWRLYYATLAFMSAPESKAAFLFGSSARSMRNPDADIEEYWLTPVGNDLDLIIAVDADIYESWTERVNAILAGESCEGNDCQQDNDSYHSCKSERLQAALKLLGAGTSVERSPLYGWLDTLHSIVPLDVHLMPTDWQDRLDELQQHLPHKDPDFMRKIATDAILLADQKPHSFADWELDLTSRLDRIREEDLAAEFGEYYSSLLQP